MQPGLSWGSLCRPGCSHGHGAIFLLCFPGAKITGMRHRALQQESCLSILFMAAWHPREFVLSAQGAGDRGCGFSIFSRGPLLVHNCSEVCEPDCSGQSSRPAQLSSALISICGIQSVPTLRQPPPWREPCRLYHAEQELPTAGFWPGKGGTDLVGPSSGTES